MAKWQELIAKWEKEELIDTDNNPFNPDDEPDWDEEDPVDLYRPWRE